MLEISTSDYQISKKVQIDGIDFEVRPMTTSETIRLSALGEKIGSDTDDPKEVMKKFEEFQATFLSVFDKPEEARKVFDKIPAQSWFEVYQKIMKEA